ncbi:MAG: hypothetical protein H7211_00755 [Aquabacterium sp.]|nr:hypothetical protein [Ferruginibacter sp.]
MNLKQQKIFFKFSKISLLLLYIPFFIVQGFFNLDTPFSYKQTSCVTIGIQVAGKKATPSFHSDKANNKEGSIRLNKRFQPESSPIIVPPIFEVAVYFVKANLFYTYPYPLLPSSHLLANKLRGPPAVV